MEQSHVDSEWYACRDIRWTFLNPGRGSRSDKGDHERGERDPHRPRYFVERPVESDNDAQPCTQDDPGDCAGCMEGDGVHGGGECQDLSCADQDTEDLS